MVSAIRKSLAAAALGLTLLGGLGLGGPAAMASGEEGIVPYDTVNRNLTLNLIAGTTYGTTWEPKETYSSTFVQVNSMGTVDWCFLYADGRNYEGQRVNCTNNGQAYLDHEGYYKLHNTVVESGYRQVQVTAYRTSNPGIISGFWSPDSTDQSWYISLNP